MEIKIVNEPRPADFMRMSVGSRYTEVIDSEEESEVRKATTKFTSQASKSKAKIKTETYRFIRKRKINWLIIITLLEPEQETK